MKLKHLTIIIFCILYIQNIYTQNTNENLIFDLNSFIEKNLEIKSDVESIVIEEILCDNQNINVYMFYSLNTTPPVYYILIKHKEQYSIINAKVRDFISFLTDLNTESNLKIEGTSLLKCLQQINECSLRSNPIITKDSIGYNIVYHEFLYLKEY